MADDEEKSTNKFQQNSIEKENIYAKIISSNIIFTIMKNDVKCK